MTGHVLRSQWKYHILTKVRSNQQEVLHSGLWLVCFECDSLNFCPVTHQVPLSEYFNGRFPRWIWISGASDYFDTRRAENVPANIKINPRNIFKAFSLTPATMFTLWLCSRLFAARLTGITALWKFCVWAVKQEMDGGGHEKGNLCFPSERTGQIQSGTMSPLAWNVAAPLNGERCFFLFVRVVSRGDWTATSACCC